MLTLEDVMESALSGASPQRWLKHAAKLAISCAKVSHDGAKMGTETAELAAKLARNCTKISHNGAKMGIWGSSWEV